MFSRAREVLSQRKALLLPWVILLVAAINVIFIGGKRRTFAVFITALHDQFHNTTGRMELNWIGDSYTAVGFFLMSVTTNLLIQLDRPYRRAMFVAAVLIFISCFSSSVVPSPGYMFLTHTVLHGIGSTIILSTTALIVGEYFDKDSRYHVLATTLVSGGPYGALLFAPIYGAVVEHYGWRVAFRVIGVMFLVEVMLGALAFIPLHNEYGTLQNTESEVSGTTFITEEDLKRPEDLNSTKKRRLYTVIPWLHLKQNFQIFLWLLERVVHNIVLYSLMMNLVDFMTDAEGSSISKATVINLLFGAGESVTFTVGVFFGDRARGKLILCFLIATMIACVLLFLAVVAIKNVDLMLTLVFFIGMTVGMGNTSIYATSEEVMRIHGSVAFPSTKLMAACGLFMAPLFSGLVIDTFGFKAFFICQALLTGVRCLLLAGIWLILRTKPAFNAHEEGAVREPLNSQDTALTVNNTVPQPLDQRFETENWNTEVKLP